MWSHSNVRHPLRSTQKSHSTEFRRVVSLTGTIPIAHATGGLLDTIEDFSPFGEGTGTGFLFRKPDVEHLIRAIDRALDTFRYNKRSRFRISHFTFPFYCRFNKEGWQKLRLGMKRDFSWSRSAASYERVIKNCLQQRQLSATTTFSTPSSP